MRDRMSRDPSLMTLRRSTVEQPFGTIKAWMGAMHFRMRRLTHVRTEMAFNVPAYNIKRRIALVGVRQLLAAIPACTGATGSVRRPHPPQTVLGALQTPKATAEARKQMNSQFSGKPCERRSPLGFNTALAPSYPPTLRSIP